MSPTPQSTLRVLLLENDPLDADLLSDTLGRSYPECEVLRVDTAVGFERALESFMPDVILANHGVASFSSLEALQITQSRRPGVPFILVSGSFGEVTAESFRRGAADFVRKADLSRLVPCISSALRQREPLRKLSERQREVFRLLAAGRSMRQIAAQLGLSIKTVETHRAEVMRRLEIRDLAGLVRYAIRVGIVSVTQ